MEYLPGPVKNISTNMRRYMSASSFIAKGSFACITKNATHIAIVMGIRHRRNSAPIMNPIEQNTSANITSENDSVLLIPNGSGKLSDVSSKAIHLAIPWLRNISPNTMRAARITRENLVCDSFSRKRSLFISFIKKSVTFS